MLFNVGRWGRQGSILRTPRNPSACWGERPRFVALLLWLYYSAQIFLCQKRAEFTAQPSGAARCAAPDQPTREGRTTEGGLLPVR